MKLSKLKLNANNPRTIKDEKFKQLVKSLQDFPEMMAKRPLVCVTDVDGKLYPLGGNMRLKALQELGLKEIPDEWVMMADEWPNEKRREFVIKDNVGFGEWDWGQIASDWPEVEEWGLDVPDAFKVQLEATEDDYEIPETIETDIVIGDLFQIGEHRLLCGDSTDSEQVAKLMGGDKAQLCFTSPPYALQRKEQYGGTDAKDYWNWFILIQENVRKHLLEVGHFIVNIKPHASEKQRNLYVFDLVLSMVREKNWLFVDEFCWLRVGIPQQVVNRFKNGFEPCYWFAAGEDYIWHPKNVRHESDSVPKALGKGAGDTNAAKRQGKGGGAIQGNEILSGLAYPNNVLDFKQNAEAIGHPAAFPIQLPNFFIKCMTDENDILYEPFTGSGSTMVAAHQLNRKCYGMELDPKYCQVIVDRMLKLDPNIKILKNDSARLIIRVFASAIRSR